MMKLTRMDQQFDKACIRILQEFLSDVFNWDRDDSTPSLEDVFTCIDLSANSGHSLSAKYDSARLRAIRRILIHRLFRVLERSYRPSDTISAFLRHFIHKRTAERVGFVVLNWDVVLERHLALLYPGYHASYGIPGNPFFIPYVSGSPIAVAKIHGSSNWAYCDNCRRLVVEQCSEIGNLLGEGKILDDLRLFHNLLDVDLVENYDRHLRQDRISDKCKCGGRLTPHIATFSYRKSFRTHAFTGSWQEAERVLSNAKHWIFVGYSFPEADYEFKHLLKTCEMTNTKKPKKITVVLKHDQEAATKYQSFFGNHVIDLHQDALAGYVRRLTKS